MSVTFSKSEKEQILKFIKRVSNKVSIGRFSQGTKIEFTPAEKIYKDFVKVLKKAGTTNRIAYLFRASNEAEELYKNNRAKFADKEATYCYIYGRDAVIVSKSIKEKVDCTISDKGVIIIDGIEVTDGSAFIEKLVKTSEEYYDSSVDAAIKGKKLLDEDEDEELPSIDDEYYND